MRAMILAAGLGSRLRPLTDLRPKPALPVRGVPVIATLLELLHHHGIREVILNCHHLPEILRETVARHTPAGMRTRFSEESSLLGTGGGLRAAAEFLRESDPCLVLAGDMLLDTDLTALVNRHREANNLATLLLLRDPRSRTFGSIGIDGEKRVRRIGDGRELGTGGIANRGRDCERDRGADLVDERNSGVFVGVRCLSSRAFESLPDRDVFEDLRDWLVPLLRAGADDVRGDLQTSEQCRWIPVGTPDEYLCANFETTSLSYLDLDARARMLGARLAPDAVIGAGATVGKGARLERVVVWDGERVPDGFHARSGVFAGGRFHRCGPDAEVESRGATA